MPWWFTPVVEIAKLWQAQALVALALVAVILVVAGRRWVRRHYREVLILMRGVAIHMIQNRPPTDDQNRLQANLNWWETEVARILPRAGATPGEVGRFQALGNVYHPTPIAEKIARLDAIIERLEGR